MHVTSVLEPNATTLDTEYGPWSRALGQMYIVTTIVMSFGAADIKPMFHTAAIGLAIGSLLLAPKKALLDMRISLASIMMLSVMGLSALWTADSVTTTFVLRNEIPRALFLALIVGVLPAADVIAGLKKSMWVIILMTFGALLAIPATRAHDVIAGTSEPYPGWHGLFRHKNSMSPYLVFAFATLLVWDRGRISRPLGLLALSALLVGSTSVTGISTAAFVGSCYVWIVLFRRSKNRWSGGFLVASVAVGACLAVAGGAAITAISASSEKGASFSGRTFIWEAAFNAITDRPLLGYGYGGLFAEPPNDISRKIWAEIGFEVPHPHSGILDVLIQLGVIGGAIFGAMFVATLLGGFTIWHQDQRMANWIMLIASAQLVMGLSEPVFLGPWVIVSIMLRGMTLRVLPSWREGHTNAYQGDDEPGVPVESAARRDEEASEELMLTSR